jgi:hypothetical protein
MRKTLRAPILLLILVATGLVPAALAAQSLVTVLTLTRLSTGSVTAAEVRPEPLSTPA